MAERRRSLSLSLLRRGLGRGRGLAPKLVEARHLARRRGPERGPAAGVTVFVVRGPFVHAAQAAPRQLGGRARGYGGGGHAYCLFVHARWRRWRATGAARTATATRAATTPIQNPRRGCRLVRCAPALYVSVSGRHRAALVSTQLGRAGQSNF